MTDTRASTRRRQARSGASPGRQRRDHLRSDASPAPTPSRPGRGESGRFRGTVTVTAGSDATPCLRPGVAALLVASPNPHPCRVEPPRPIERARARMLVADLQELEEVKSLLSEGSAGRSAGVRRGRLGASPRSTSTRATSSSTDISRSPVSSWSRTSTPRRPRTPRPRPSRPASAGGAASRRRRSTSSRT